MIRFTANQSHAIVFWWHNWNFIARQKSIELWRQCLWKTWAGNSSITRNGLEYSVSITQSTQLKFIEFAINVSMAHWLSHSGWMNKIEREIERKKGHTKQQICQFANTQSVLINIIFRIDDPSKHLPRMSHKQSSNLPFPLL